MSRSHFACWNAVGADVPFFERNGGTGPVVRGLDGACTETETMD